MRTSLVSEDRLKLKGGDYHPVRTEISGSRRGEQNWEIWSTMAQSLFGGGRMLFLIAK